MASNLSGQILINGSPLAGVFVLNAANLSDPGVFTDGSGNYTLVVANLGLAVVTPGLEGYGFNPYSRNVVVTGDVTGLDFAAQLTEAFVRQKLPVDFTSGFSAFGSSGFSGLLVLGNTRIDLWTGDIYNIAGNGYISGFSASSSGFSGISGFSGASGTSGPSGESGASGTSGATGATGASGESGFSGYSGESGFSGVSGYSGTNGANGDSGFSGVSGYSGTNGANGDSGFSGVSGYSGTNGANGDSGFSGVSGYSGTNGANGDSGFSGVSGYSGTAGANGNSGFSGTSGESGFSGTSGQSGFSGSTGESGFSGYSGPSGISGYSGLSGFSSDSGTSGFSGISGESGFSGGSGLSGTSGYSGTSGWSGTSGFSANTFSGTKYIFLDIAGGVDDVNAGEITGMPFIEFAANGNERARWSLIAPDDQIPGTNIIITLHWSPRNTNTGNVFWFAETKSVAVGTSVSGANMTGTLLQAGAGTAYRLQTTGNSLFISGASMAANSLLQITVGRSGTAATDTFTTFVNLHHVLLQYTAKKLVP